MSAAKRISKRRLKDDKFVDIVFHYGEILREHQRLIVGGLVVLVLLVLGVTWGKRAMHLGNEEAQQAFSTALKQLEVAMQGTDPMAFGAPEQAFMAIESENGGKDVGKWSIYYVGYCREQMGKYEEAEQDYERYLKAESNGQFALAAKLGLATCNAGVGRYKVQADMLVDLASSAKVDSAQANAWLYQAGQTYMDNGYFDLARQVFTRIEDHVDEQTQQEVQQFLEALDQVKQS